MNNRYLKALKAAFPYTLPIFAVFMFLGITYGIYMNGKGFGALYSAIISATVFAGSMQFVAVNMLAGAFDPIGVLLMTLMVNARHIFYGISMLEKYRGLGIKKIYMIFGLCDETFSVNCFVTVPKDVDSGLFMFFVTLLNQSYWVLGSFLGGAFGEIISTDIVGIDFAMTAMFVAIFTEQWRKEKNHLSALTGLIVSAACLVVFGADKFIIPALFLIVAALMLFKNKTGEGAKI